REPDLRRPQESGAPVDRQHELAPRHGRPESRRLARRPENRKQAMEFFRIRRTIPFMRHALVFNVISALLFVASVILLATRGLNFSIEFVGGTVMEVSYDHAAEPEKIRTALQQIGLTDVSVQNFGTSRDVLIRLPLKTKEGQSQNAERDKQSKAVLDALKASDPSVQQRRVEFVGSQVGSELATDGA